MVGMIYWNKYKIQYTIQYVNVIMLVMCGGETWLSSLGERLLAEEQLGLVLTRFVKGLEWGSKHTRNLTSLSLGQRVL